MEKTQYRSMAPDARILSTLRALGGVSEDPLGSAENPHVLIQSRRQDLPYEDLVLKAWV